MGKRIFPPTLLPVRVCVCKRHLLGLDATDVQDARTNYVGCNGTSSEAHF